MFSFLFVWLAYILASGYEPDLWILQGPLIPTTATTCRTLAPVCAGAMLLGFTHASSTIWVLLRLFVQEALGKS